MIILCINDNNAVTSYNHGRLPRPSKFPRSREKNSSNFIANLGTSPQKTSLTLLYSDYRKLYLRCTQLQWAAIVQSVERLATGWTVRGSSLGGVQDFPAPVQTDPGAYRAYYTMGTGSLPGVKRLMRGVYHPPPSSAEVKERVELYLCSPSGSSGHVIGWTLP
jgi:hypothetical protein